MVAQVTILDHITIQKQGPLFTTSAHWVVIVYVHWCIETVKGENDRMFVQQAAVTWLFCVFLALGTQKETDTEKKNRKLYLIEMIWRGWCFIVGTYGYYLDFDCGSEMSILITSNLKENHDLFWGASLFFWLVVTK